MKEWLEIRPVQPEDEVDLKVLWSSDGARFWPFFHSWKDHWERPDHPGRFWLVAVAKVDGRVLGSVRGAFKATHNVIHEIVVNESDRRTGVGEDMLAAVMGIGAHPHIALKTNADNEVSNAFYLRQGYMLTGFEHTRRKEVMFLWSKNGESTPELPFPVHLEGMGVLGSLTALTLAREGVPFTWSDPDFPSAWRASGGIVLPSGSPGHVRWLKAVREQDFPWAERGSFWSNVKNPGAAKPAADLGALRMAKLPSVHVAVQSMVAAARGAFGALRTEPWAGGTSPERADVLRVMTHGFNERMTHYQWGWTQLVEVEIDERLREASPHRPSFALVRNMVEKAYCAPLPGTGLYVLGSSIVTQKQPKEREIGGVIDKALGIVEGLAGGLVRVTNLFGAPRQGWRPADKTKNTEVVSQPSEKRILYPALSHSGVSEGYFTAERGVHEIRWLLQEQYS